MQVRGQIFAAIAVHNSVLALDTNENRGIELRLADESWLAYAGGSADGNSAAGTGTGVYMRQHSLRRCDGRGAAAGILLGLFIGSSFWLASTGLADEPVVLVSSAAPSAADLQRWVRELDDEAYSIREAATKRLVQAGAVAVDSLAAAVLSDSAEVSWRASDALARIAQHGDEATLERVSQALEKLSSARPSLGKLAREVKTQQHNYRHNRAIAKIRGLGGNITGHWQGNDELGEPAMEAMEVAVAPAIAFEAAPFDLAEVEPAEEARPAPRGIFGLLARLVVPELVPAAEPVPADFKFVEPPVAPDADPAVRRIDVPELPIVPAAEVARVEPALIPPPAPVVEEARIVEAVPAAIPGPVVPPMILEEEEAPIGAADAVEIVALDVGFIGPGMVIGGDFPGEGEDYAELVLGKKFRGADADLAVLNDLPELYSLKIDGAKLTDKSLEYVAALSRLTTLELSGTEMSSAALRKLRAKRPSLSIICRNSAMLGINSGLEGPCVLTSVFYRSGAYEAGLRDGDEITEVDGQKVRDFSDLTIAVYPHKAGDKLKVKYNRDGKSYEALVTLKPRNVVETAE